MTASRHRACSIGAMLMPLTSHQRTTADLIRGLRPWRIKVDERRDEGDVPERRMSFAVGATTQRLVSGVSGGAGSPPEGEQNVSADFLKTLQRALAGSEDAALITEADSVDAPGPRVVYANAAFERMTGYVAVELLGRSPKVLQGQNTDPAALGRIRKALEGLQPVREDLVNYRKDGSEYHVDLSIAPVTDESGQVTHWFSMQRETSAQYKLRKELRSSNLLLRTMTESVPHLLWTADSDGRREWVSDQFAEFVGALVEDCLNDGWLRYVHPGRPNKCVSAATSRPATAADQHVGASSSQVEWRVCVVSEAGCPALLFGWNCVEMGGKLHQYRRAEGCRSRVEEK